MPKLDWLLAPKNLAEIVQRFRDFLGDVLFSFSAQSPSSNFSSMKASELNLDVPSHSHLAELQFEPKIGPKHTPLN